MSENLRNFTKAVYALDAVVKRVPSDAWDNDSPCEGWTARDVLAHQAGVFNALAHIARTGEMVLPEMPDDRSDPVGLWNEARDGVLEALDQQGALHHDGKFWFGPMDVDTFISVVQWDPVGHAWDIAQAAGIDHHVPADLAEQSYERISAMQEPLRKMRLMGEPVDVGDDADPMSKFLALVGRDPS